MVPDPCRGRPARSTTRRRHRAREPPVPSSGVSYKPVIQKSRTAIGNRRDRNGFLREGPNWPFSGSSGSVSFQVAAASHPARRKTTPQLLPPIPPTISESLGRFPCVTCKPSSFTPLPIPRPLHPFIKVVASTPHRLCGLIQFCLSKSILVVGLKCSSPNRCACKTSRMSERNPRFSTTTPVVTAIPNVTNQWSAPSHQSLPPATGRSPASRRSA